MGILTLRGRLQSAPVSLHLPAPPSQGHPWTFSPLATLRCYSLLQPLFSLSSAPHQGVTASLSLSSAPPRGVTVPFSFSSAPPMRLALPERSLGLAWVCMPGRWVSDSHKDVSDSTQGRGEGWRERQTEEESFVTSSNFPTSFIPSHSNVILTSLWTTVQEGFTIFSDNPSTWKCYFLKVPLYSTVYYDTTHFNTL